MKSPIALTAAACALLGGLSLSSCKPSDTPELQAKREQQTAELHRLDGELALAQDRLDHMPKDRSAELTALKKEAAENEKTLSDLQDEVTTLQAKKADLDKQLADYRQKFRLR